MVPFRSLLMTWALQITEYLRLFSCSCSAAKALVWDQPMATNSWFSAVAREPMARLSADSAALSLQIGDTATVVARVANLRVRRGRK